jgi:hypothetical protein
VNGQAASVPDEPLDHVLRAALPWRDGPVLTECGKLPDPGMPLLTVPEFVAKVKREGQMRSSKTTCMTCWTTAARHHVVSWDADPVGVMAREVGWARAHAPGWARDDDPTALLFRNELLAIAELITRHQEEFAGLVEGIGDAPSLGDRRRGKRSRRPAAQTIVRT